MNWLHRLAWRTQDLSGAESSHEQLLAWHLKLLWVWFWQIQRQYEVGPYRLDLAIVLNQQRNTGLAIEVDGRYWHRQGDRPLKDASRDNYLEKRGWEVVRFTDKEVELSPLSCARHAAALGRAIKKRGR